MLHRSIAVGFCTLILSVTLATSAAPITIDAVYVGNLGNASNGDGRGRVDYGYQIGATEVTNEQYARFLNEKAKSDPLGLYNANMSSQTRGGIIQTGTSGNFIYTTKPDMGNKPVNYVSWYDSIRFANWLHNGQGDGDTESGSYTLLGGTADPINGSTITRNSGARWVLPTDDEWFKAAYHQPWLQGGHPSNYWDFPGRSNAPPDIATADFNGDIRNPGYNVANYSSGARWGGEHGNVTTVGSAGPLGESYYGTSDQGGNVEEWNEAAFVGSLGTWRIARGGSFASTSTDLLFAMHRLYQPITENRWIGFRVAHVPEPSTLMLGLLACVALVLARRLR